MTEIEELRAEMRGRMMLAETVAIVSLAHVARLAPNAARFITHAMYDAERAVEYAAKSAADEVDKYAAAVALERFAEFTRQLLAHINKITDPMGRT
jgi:hypothetical protein